MGNLYHYIMDIVQIEFSLDFGSSRLEKPSRLRFDILYYYKVTCRTIGAKILELVNSSSYSLNEDLYINLCYLGMRYQQTSNECAFQFSDQEMFYYGQSRKLFEI